MKYNDLVEKILNESNYPQLDKEVKKLSDPKFYDEGKEELENDFRKNYDNEEDNEDWAPKAINNALQIINKKYHLSSKDKKILNDLLLSYAYILETRGL